MTDYGYGVEISEGYDEAIVRARLALRGEGFSIISEMHVGGMLAEAGPGRQYLIMGGYSAAVTQPVGGPDVQAAVQFPCNVVVQEKDAGALVAALDPGEDADLHDAAQSRAAGDARSAIERVMHRIVEGPS